MSSIDIHESDIIEEIQRDIQELKEKLQLQEDLLKGVTKWQGSQLYKEFEVLQQKRQEKQAEYKQLMKDRYQFVRSNTSVQNVGEAFLDEKLNKVVRTLTHEMENILESRASKSSLSSCNFDKVESIDWLHEQKAEKYAKQQEKILMEIKELEKILQQIN